jgi:hypothetical protein
MTVGLSGLDTLIPIIGQEKNVFVPIASVCVQDLSEINRHVSPSLPSHRFTHICFINHYR